MMETGLLMLRCLAVTHDYDGDGSVNVRCLAVTHDYDGDGSVNVTVSSCDPRL